ncbi:MAG: hypothetical protein AB4050_10590 [Synechococcus sp.]
MAQHSKPLDWLKFLAASPLTRDCTINPHDPNPDPRRRIRLYSLTGLMSAIGGLAISCIALPAHANTERVYIVEVLSNSEEVLEVVRTEVSDAYIVTKEDGTQSIIAGTFLDEANARRQATELHALNVSPTSISPFEYTPEDESNLADASNTTDNPDGASAANSQQPDEPATTEFAASSAPMPSDSASNSALVRPSTETATSDPKAPSQQAPQSVAAAPQVNQLATPGGGSSSTPINSDRQYSTLVPVPSGTEPTATLVQVQHFFPEASLQTYNQGQAVQTGTFSHRSQAQLQAEWLATKGLHAISVPTDPLSSRNSAATPPPPVSSPTTSSPTSTTATNPVNQPEIAASTGTAPSTSSPPTAPPVTPPTGALTSVAPAPANPQVSAPPTNGAATNHPAQMNSPSADIPAANTALQPGQPAETPSTDATPAATGTSAIAAAPPVASSAYWVLVADPMGEQLNAIQAIVPTAEAAVYNQQQVVRTGEFATEQDALDQVRYLSTQGYEAGIFTADDPAVN